MKKECREFSHPLKKQQTLQIQAYQNNKCDRKPNKTQASAIDPGGGRRRNKGEGGGLSPTIREVSMRKGREL